MRKSGNQHALWGGHGEISGYYWRRILTSAAKRKIELLITIEYAWKQFLSQEGKCAITGLDLSFAPNTRDKARLQTASLDRIDSAHGYIPGNVQWVHKTVNLMKGTLNNQEFLDWCTRIVEHSLQRINHG